MFLGILPRLEYDKDEMDHSSFSIVLLNIGKLPSTPLVRECYYSIVLSRCRVHQITFKKLVYLYKKEQKKNCCLIHNFLHSRRKAHEISVHMRRSKIRRKQSNRISRVVNQRECNSPQYLTF